MTEEELIELEEYANIDDTEAGESIRKLCSLVQYEEYLSKVFIKTLFKELKTLLEYYRKHSKIIAKEYTYMYKYKSLEWFNLLEGEI